MRICSASLACDCSGALAVASSAKVQDDPTRPKGYTPKSINVRGDVMVRVARCMKLEGLSVFSDFANSALAAKCRAIEREHGIDSKGKTVK